MHEGGPPCIGSGCNKTMARRAPQRFRHVRAPRRAGNRRFGPVPTGAKSARSRRRQRRPEDARERGLQKATPSARTRSWPNVAASRHPAPQAARRAGRPRRGARVQAARRGAALRGAGGRQCPAWPLRCSASCAGSRRRLSSEQARAEHGAHLALPPASHPARRVPPLTHFRLVPTPFSALRPLARRPSSSPRTTS